MDQLGPHWEAVGVYRLVKGVIGVFRLIGNSLVALCMFAAVTLLAACGAEPVVYDDAGLDAEEFTKAMPVPPLLEDKDPSPKRASFELTAQSGPSRFFKDKSTRTFGYNGAFLGPTIRAARGERVEIKVNNELGETTTVRWQGLIARAEVSGVAREPIAPGDSWTTAFTIRQEAATLWYRPDPLGRAGEQLYAGLAGAFLIDDAKTDRLGLPQDYGENDFPVIIQDRKFNRDGKPEYKSSTLFSRNGMFGDRVLINGIIAPVLEVKNIKTRLRLINASNTRVYNLALSDGTRFTQIGGGGLLPAPVRLKSLELAPGERADIVIDFAGRRVGDELVLEDPEFDLLKLVVAAPGKERAVISKRLAVVPKLDPRQAHKTRKFELSSAVAVAGEPSLMINGKSFDIERIDERVKAGTTEIWEVANPAQRGENFSSHPFNIQGARFQVLERNGRTAPANEAGWKDTIFLHGNDTIRLIVDFTERGLFAYSCGMLEHEDAGMMGQFRVD